ncbi:MAG TPA: HAMP domain-containing sensor histidine kinase [Anaerolineales bacterium]|nr:HAMP domain-containing sensor histidine kinase [Anaerolineales bacterium]
MFTSLRSRLWLSYALVITVALGIVLLVLLAFLIRNPFLSREVQGRLRTVKSLVTATPRKFINNRQLLEEIAQTYDVRVLLFDANRNLVFDTNPDASVLPFPRQSLLERDLKRVRDANGAVWLYAFKRLSKDRVLVVAAPSPRVPVLNIFKDELLLPLLEGGAVALLLSLILAFALSRWVADPLQQVIVAARKYPSQETNVVSPRRGPHEVQSLTQAFNSMVGRVQRIQKSQRDFVANVSHELKTPLTSIQGFAQAILDDTADTSEARKQAAQIIYSEAGRMHRMALDLLDLARLEAGTADIKMSSVDMGALLRTVIEKFTPQTQKAGVDLQLNIPEPLPTLVGDGDRLAQVFTNLVDNALKFTPAGGQITLLAMNAGAEVEISITDTGEGIPGEALPHLFDRFYQVDRSRAGGDTAAGRRGAGLGLSIVQEILQAHGGRISVRSEVGHGTTFVIHLPLAQK